MRKKIHFRYIFQLSIIKLLKLKYVSEENHKILENRIFVAK